MKNFTQMYGNTVLAQQLGYNNVRLATDEDNDVVYQTAQKASSQPTLQSESMNPFAMPEVEGERETPAEFAQTIASGTAGALGGATAVTVGLPADVAGMIAGVIKGLSAEDGEKLATGLETWAQFSEVAGSEATLKILDSVIDSAPLSDEAKQEMREGSRLIGEWADLPVGIKAIASGIRRAYKGQPLDTPIQIEIKNSANMPAEQAQ